METNTQTGDIIHHTTRTVFNFKDRLKILFGGEVTINSEIETEHEQCLVKRSSAKTHVYSRLFDWRISNIMSTKNKGGIYINSIDNQKPLAK